MDKKRLDAAVVMPLIIANIYELAGALRARGEAIAAGVGQTQARWQVLSAASGAEPMTVPRIARRLGLSRQAVQRVADLLVEDQVARFADNPDHQSSPHLILAEKGRDALSRLTKNARRFQEELAAKLQSIDLAALRGDLRALLIALDSPRKFDRGE
jgi:DNA-binding MarR family transcriptional regulator